LDAEFADTNKRIDGVMSQAIDKALAAMSRPSGGSGKVLNQGGAPHDDAMLLDNVHRIKAALALASESDLKIGRERIIAVAARLNDLSQSEPQLSPVAWETMAELLRYNSENTPVPDVRWIGPAPELVNGFPGLFGLTEMKNVQYFVSTSRVPIDRAAQILPLRTEEMVRAYEKSRGVSSWPEDVLVVGSGDSIIVLDKLHLRNVTLKHLHIVYGGDRTVLENVRFSDCTFSLARTKRTVELTDSLLRDQGIRSFGL